MDGRWHFPLPGALRPVGATRLAAGSSGCSGLGSLWLTAPFPAPCVVPGLCEGFVPTIRSWALVTRRKHNSHGREGRPEQHTEGAALAAGFGFRTLGTGGAAAALASPTLLPVDLLVSSRPPALVLDAQPRGPVSVEERGHSCSSAGPGPDGA